MAERIGVFGGSFDPIHYGHLILAEQCREQAELDRVIFVPANMSPHKLAGPHATDRQRLEMLRLALGGQTAFELDDLEIKREGVSYTVDTLEQFKTKFGESELFFLMGTDSLEAFSTWKNPEKICKLATPLVFDRHSSTTDQTGIGLESLSNFVGDKRLTEITQHKIMAPRIELSSSDIRHRAELQKSVRYMTPRSVEKYIETNRVYSIDEPEIKKR